ncbi:MAG: two-component system, OmpR family, sensor kinase [Pseudonocardiales bacterium]|jgi:signal transduction histidine kinase|nr:two-component system, OmpR family, sensor kinase [Pseudonocardiales bacterium]
MLVIDSSRAKAWVAAGWIVFSSVNAYLMFKLPGQETIPYHLIWVSFVLLYGLASWSRATTWGAFSAITFVTAFPLLEHARSGVIGMSECSEIVLMAVIAALLVWHVNRHQAAQRRLAELRESERERSQNREIATRFGSHELRTRLTIARGFAEYIHDKTADEETRSDAGLILVEMDKASALATNLMTFVRVAALPTLAQIDLDALIESAVRRWSASVDRVWISSASAGMVLGDAERFEAALDCLIENATKFTTLTDSISIRARADGPGAVVVTVEDSGAGIPPQDVHRVTELFHTSSTAGNRAGSGLGLPIVRAIVEARGGSLQVASLVGAGTRVTIRMPRGNLGSASAHSPFAHATSQDTGTEHPSPLRQPAAVAER